MRRLRHARLRSRLWAAPSLSVAPLVVAVLLVSASVVTEHVSAQDATAPPASTDASADAAADAGESSAVSAERASVDRESATETDETDEDDAEGTEPNGNPDEPVDPESEDGEDIVDSLGDVIGDLGATLGRENRPHGRIRWDPTWPRYRFDELVVTLGMGLVIGLEELLPTRGDPNWSVITDLDRDVAAAMGVNSIVARDTLEEISDALVAGLFIWPLAVDSLLYAGLGEGAWDVAWQLSLISLEVFSINHALTVMVRLLTRREGPLGRFCREEPGYDADPICADQPPAESFWSGHVSNAFAGAALVCLHHDVLDLYGDEATDMLACGTALAAAATTGLFRIMSDYHWVTDVLTGAVVGSLTGILIPWLLHYQGGAHPPLRGSEAPTITFMPMMGQDYLGLSAIGLL